MSALNILVLICGAVVGWLGISRLLDWHSEHSNRQPVAPSPEVDEDWRAVLGLNDNAGWEDAVAAYEIKAGRLAATNPTILTQGEEARLHASRARLAKALKAARIELRA